MYLEISRFFYIVYIENIFSQIKCFEYIADSKFGQYSGVGGGGFGGVFDYYSGVFFYFFYGEFCQVFFDVFYGWQMEVFWNFFIFFI